MEKERKFIVDEQKFDQYLANNSNVERVMIEQYYFNAKDATFRLRIKDDVAYICLKKFVSKGINEEIESEIDIQTALQIITNVTKKTVIKKTRFNLNIDGLKWEVDVFYEPKITLAEIELDDLETEINLPDFITKEVTGDKNYSNEAISRSL